MGGSVGGMGGRVVYGLTHAEVWGWQGRPCCSPLELNGGLLEAIDPLPSLIGAEEQSIVGAIETCLYGAWGSIPRYYTRPSYVLHSGQYADSTQRNVDIRCRG